MLVDIQTKDDTVESSISCESCRRRKKRCGRELPGCKGCFKRGEECIYRNISHKRKSEPTAFASSQNKLNFKSATKETPVIQQNRIQSLKVHSENSCNNQHFNIFIFESISQSNTTTSDSDLSQSLLSPIPSKPSHKFETHLLLMLTTQIIQYDQHIIPEIDWFVNKIQLGIFGGSTKTTFQLNQEWIQELFEPNFRSKLINSYFTHFQPTVTYISKYYFFTNIDKIHPALMSVILYVGYINYHKQHPELRKYLKHCALIQLKKNRFNINLGVCQALFIFSYSMLLQGLGKQSIPYFNQACLMSSALGIHVDMPNISPEEQHQRHCIRGCAISKDSHLGATLTIQPYFLFLTPSIMILNPIYQMNPYSTDSLEELRAECICTMRYCYDRYWIPAIMHMVVYSITISNQQNIYQSKDFEKKIQFFNELYNYCMIQTLVKYLELSKRYQTEVELKIINKGAWVFCAIYYHLSLMLYSQFPPTVDPKTGFLNARTLKAVQAATAIYNITSSHPESCMYMFYHYLSAISLFYIKIIICLNSHSHIQSFLIKKFQDIYSLFILSKEKYHYSGDILEVVDTLANYFKIQMK